MRKALLTASTALVVLAGCGGTGTSDLPKSVDHKPYAVCTGKPRFCAVADLRGARPHWVSADQLGPKAARRFHRLAGTGSVPLPP